MGLYASYVLIDDEVMDRLVQTQQQLEEGELADSAALTALVEEITEDSVIEASLEENWDIMHFLLTGKDASEPEEDNLLSESIVGEIALDTETYSALIDAHRLQDISRALCYFNFNAALAEFTLGAAREAELYPNLWEGESDWEKLTKELAACYTLLSNFYALAAANQANILITIQ